MIVKRDEGKGCEVSVLGGQTAPEDNQLPPSLLHCSYG